MRIQTIGPGPSADAGMTAFIPYVYRGTGRDTLTPNMSGLGARRNKGRRRLKPVGPCPVCGWGLSGRKHRQECGS